MSKVTNLFKGITGAPSDGKPRSELDHFYLCRECGQSVDKRDLGQVFHHEEPGHSPIDLDS